MSESIDDGILDDLFHGCALAAWLTIAQSTGQWPPDSKSTQQLAYRLYEHELKRRGPDD